MSRAHRRRIRARQARVTVGPYSIMLNRACQTKACRRYAKQVLQKIDPVEVKKNVAEQLQMLAHFGYAPRYRVRLVNEPPPGPEDRNWETMSEYFGKLTR